MNLRTGLIRNFARIYQEHRINISYISIIMQRQIAVAANFSAALLLPSSFAAVHKMLRIYLSGPILWLSAHNLPALSKCWA